MAPRWPQDGPKMGPRSAYKRVAKKRTLFPEQPPTTMIVTGLLKNKPDINLSEHRSGRSDESQGMCDSP
jgi:hypothetical protein